MFLLLDQQTRLIIENLILKKVRSFFFPHVLELVLTRSSPAASKAADIDVPSSSIRMKSHPSPGAPAPSASHIQTRSSPNIAAIGPSVGAPGPSSSAGPTIPPKSNRKKA